jgi:putative transposase
MQRLQAFKYELMPSGEHVRNMRRFAGARRFVYNKALASQIERHRQGLKRLSHAGLCRLLTRWRNSCETPWLADSPVHTLQQGLKDLQCAYRNFFGKRAGFPQFRKKGFADRFHYPDPKQIRLDQLNSRIPNFRSRRDGRGPIDSDGNVCVRGGIRFFFGGSAAAERRAASRFEVHRTT